MPPLKNVHSRVDMDAEMAENSSEVAFLHITLTLEEDTHSDEKKLIIRRHALL